MARDRKWFVTTVIIIFVIIIAVILNFQNNTDTATRVENTIEVDNGDLDINWSNYSTVNVKLASSIEITKPGIYHLTGILYDGAVSIKPDNNAVVKIVLDNVTINNSNGPAIACYSGDDVIIELIGTNTITDGSAYASTYDEDITGAIYSKSDLTFAGDGELILTGNYADGIVSKDDLTFRGGNYDITTQDDGIRGKDSVHITDGSFTISSTADAIKSTNESDKGKGFVLIENGNFNLNTGAKGIKATNSVLIHDGAYAITTTDDSIHSDHYVSIKGGEISINAGDDAVHANRELEISGGSIAIAKAYEGLEAQKVTINDGNISISASDDGINAGGGADSSATNRANKSLFDADEKCSISINGGNIYVNTSGDGLDSNGWLYINGGKTIVDGPSSNGNGALDAGMGVVMNGGEAIAIGTSEMAENLGQTSSVNNISIFLKNSYPKNTEISIVDKNGNTIISHVSAKSFSHIAVGTSAFNLGDTYSLYLDDELYANITISGIVTTFGSSAKVVR